MSASVFVFLYFSDVLNLIRPRVRMRSRRLSEIGFFTRGMPIQEILTESKTESSLNGMVPYKSLIMD